MQTTDECEQESQQPKENSTPPQAPETSAAEPTLDCYPYTFSPLLLFAQANYFDKGYSNYNSVAKFFAQAVEVDMLSNVLYERKNMLYEDLLEHVTSNMMLVTCCIGAWASLSHWFSPLCPPAEQGTRACVSIFRRHSHCSGAHSLPPPCAFAFACPMCFTTFFARHRRSLHCVSGAARSHADILRPFECIALTRERRFI